MKPVIYVSALACALAAAPAAAQDAVPGPVSVSLGIGGGYTIGLWTEASPRLRAGVEAGTSVSRLSGGGREDDYTNVVIQPAVKVFSGDGDLRPYTLLGLYAQQSVQRIAHGTDAEAEWRRRGLGARVGVGVEWQPASRVAVGGHAGLGAGWLESRSESSASVDDQAIEGWSLDTFSSGIVVHLFF